ncbi:MAG: efflux RND transporter periplasmic adaptor subunit [Bacteroidetes bacterium]|nr:MAG: efflux RND transporter periplasmic adaptor subunit [Bacteroidota bacterium]
MKKSIIYIFLFLAFFSCKKEENQISGSLEDLQDQKISVINQIDSLNSILRKIELNMSKVDSKSNYQVVSIISPKKSDFKHYIEIQGVVKADKNIEIRPEIGGTIKNILVKEGQRVKKGQVLIQLDDSSIQDNIAELNTQLNLAKTTFERQQRLWDQKIGSEMQYLQAKTQFESLKKSKNTIINQAAKMQIKAPFSGIIDEIFPKRGELASPQLSVIRLVNLDKIYLEADVTETFLPYIKKGNEALINFPSILTEMKSEIAQVGNVINPNNRSFKTKIKIDNKNNLIKPNLLADIKIKDFEENGIIIPSSLIQKGKDGNNFVYVINKNDGDFKALKKYIKVSKEYKQESLIIDGLKLNDSLINKGSRIVKDGESVKIMN